MGEGGIQQQYQKHTRHSWRVRDNTLGVRAHYTAARVVRTCRCVRAENVNRERLNKKLFCRLYFTGASGVCLLPHAGAVTLVVSFQKDYVRNNQG